MQAAATGRQGTGWPSWFCPVLLTLWLYSGLVLAQDTCDLNCQQRQASALQQLLRATGPATWLNSSGWLQYNAADTSGQHCRWNGVSCSAGAVTALLLPANNLQGTLPPAMWGDLAPSLVMVDLHGNRLTGTIPVELWTLPQLRSLSLAENRLRGSLPVRISNGSALLYLSLHTNLLTGPLPTDWNTAAQLLTLTLGNNKLSGGLVARANLSTSLVILDLRNNSLSGNIAGGALPPMLEVLDLAGNALTGVLPADLDDFTQLQRLDVDDNLLRGSLPKLGTGGTNLQALDLSDNYFTGGVPASWAGHKALQQIILADNNLSGALPDNFAALHQLEVVNVARSGLHGTGINGTYLPTWVTFDTTQGRVVSGAGSGSDFLACYNTVGNISTMPHVRMFSFSPDYYEQQGCICAPGYVVDPRSSGRHLWCMPETAKSFSDASVVVPTLAAVCLATILAAAWFKVSLPEYKLKAAKRKGAPEQGRCVTLLLTDVESSTSLWEAQPEAMNEAIAVHDRVMRSLLTKYSGYEVTTEGDAFLIAFHDAGDALAYCCATQQALLVADWPSALCEPASANISSAAAAAGNQASEVAVTVAYDDGKVVRLRSIHDVANVPTSSILYRGLRVRMGLATGIAEKVTVHALTQRTEYAGIVMELAKAISETPCGGQIIMDKETFQGVQDRLLPLAKELPQRPDHQALAQAIRGSYKEQQDLLDLTQLSWDANTNHQADPFGADSQLMPLLQPATSDKGAEEADAPPLVVVHSGRHILHGRSGEVDLWQALVPGLEARYLEQPPLVTKVTRLYGYLAAPEVASFPLTRSLAAPGQPGRPGIVTLVSCSIAGLDVMMAINAVLTKETMAPVFTTILRVMRRRGGYKCGREAGTIVVAFRRPAQALQFCLLVQDAMLTPPRVIWPPALLDMDACAEVRGGPGNQALLFKGPRLKMAICDGVPDAVTPNPASGRAAYHGPFMARLARVGLLAAHGGQILAPWSTAQRIMADLLGAPAPNPLFGQPQELQMKHEVKTELSASKRNSLDDGSCNADRHWNAAARNLRVMAAFPSPRPQLRLSVSPRATAQLPKAGPSPSAETAEAVSTPSQSAAGSAGTGAPAVVASSLQQGSPRPGVRRLRSGRLNLAPQPSKLRLTTSAAAELARLQYDGELTTSAPAVQEGDVTVQLAPEVPRVACNALEHGTPEAASTGSPLSQDSHEGAASFAEWHHDSRSLPTSPTASQRPSIELDNLHALPLDAGGPVPAAGGVEQHAGQHAGAASSAAGPQGLIERKGLRQGGTPSSGAGSPLVTGAAGVSSPGKGWFHTFTNPAASPHSSQGAPRRARGSLDTTADAHAGSQQGLQLLSPAGRATMLVPSGAAANSLTVAPSGDSQVMPDRASAASSMTSAAGDPRPGSSTPPQPRVLGGSALRQLHDDPWRRVKRIEVSHFGRVSFRGVAEQLPLMQFSADALCARRFPTEMPCKRARLVAPGWGLVYVVTYEDCIRTFLAEMQHAAQRARRGSGSGARTGASLSADSSAGPTGPPSPRIASGHSTQSVSPAPGGLPGRADADGHGGRSNRGSHSPAGELHFSPVLELQAPPHASDRAASEAGKALRVQFGAAPLPRAPPA